MNTKPKNPHAVALGKLGGSAGRGPAKGRPILPGKRAAMLAGFHAWRERVNAAKQQATQEPTP